MYELRTLIDIACNVLAQEELDKYSKLSDWSLIILLMKNEKKNTIIAIKFISKKIKLSITRIDSNFDGNLPNLKILVSIERWDFDDSNGAISIQNDWIVVIWQSNRASI